MNRTVLVAVIIMLGLAVPAFGQFVGPGTSTSADVKSILAKPVDDMWVSLKGHLVQKVGRDKYIFSDGTGQIRVDIDDKYFPHGVTISPTTLIQINGEVDVEYYKSPEIDVKGVVVLPEGSSGTSSPGRFEKK